MKICKLSNFEIKNEKAALVFLSIVSCLFVLICSTTTSIFFPIYSNGDSVVFQTEGKFWAEGHLPYVEMWDLKGPIIFFVDAVGYFLFGSKIGILLIQFINIIFTDILVYKILRLRLNCTASTVWSLIVLFSFTLDYGTGNTVSEFCLPVIFLSFYLLVKWRDTWVNETNSEHHPAYALIYGVCFAVCLLSRVTNAVGVCGAVAVIVISLIIDEKWLNLLKNALMFLLGVFMVVFPFVIYFLSKDALYELYYGTIGYNLEYILNSGTSLSLNDPLGIITFIVGFANSFLLLITGIILLFTDKQRRRAGILWSAVALLSVVYFMKSNGYTHYAIIAFPYLPVAVVELSSLISEKKEREKNSFVYRSCAACMAVVITISILSGILGVKNTASEYYSHHVVKANSGTPTQIDAACEICKIIPEDEKESFVAYNCPQGLYLYLDVCPYYEYFCFQDWSIKQGPSLKSKILERFSTGDVKWILITTDSDEEVYNVIKSRYTLVEEAAVPYSEKFYQLYRINE